MAQHFNQTAQVLAVTANRLIDGEVVYLTPSGRWSANFDAVAIAHGKEEGNAILAKAQPAVAAREIIGPYLFEVCQETTGARPVSVREIIRMKGPSVRLDLGKQAEYSVGSAHV